MEWIANAFWARIGWAVGEVAIFFAVVIAIGIVALVVSVPRMTRQARCKHVRYHETGSCDAVCADCGRNLGFIGTWRDKQRALS